MDSLAVSENTESWRGTLKDIVDHWLKLPQLVITDGDRWQCLCLNADIGSIYLTEVQLLANKHRVPVIRSNFPPAIFVCDFTVFAQNMLDMDKL